MLTNLNHTCWMWILNTSDIVTLKHKCHFHHWMHCKLSFWQISLEPVIVILKPRGDSVLIAVKLPWILLGASLIFNGAPQNIQVDLPGTGTNLWMTSSTFQKLCTFTMYICGRVALIWTWRWNLQFGRPPSGIYIMRSTQAAEMQLAVNGGQPLFILGLPMFALSLEDFLSFYTPATKLRGGGVYWIHPVRPSFCLSVHLSVRPPLVSGW